MFSRNVGFRSIYNLDKLFPNSQFDFSSAPEKSAKEAAISSSDKFHGFIPMDQLTIRVSRSSGPGGQNVNKVNTKVDVRFNVDSAVWIPAHLKELLKKNYRTRITKDGYFVMDSEKTRKQSYNLADCLDKIRFILRNLEKPQVVITEEEQEVIQARARKAASERLREKREQSSIKSSRRMDDAFS